MDLQCHERLMKRTHTLTSGIHKYSTGFSNKSVLYSSNRRSSYLVLANIRQDNVRLVSSRAHNFKLVRQDEIQVLCWLFKLPLKDA